MFYTKINQIKHISENKFKFLLENTRNLYIMNLSVFYNIFPYITNLIHMFPLQRISLLVLFEMNIPISIFNG